MSITTNYQDLSDEYVEDVDGFEGNFEGYYVETTQENLKNFLEGKTNKSSIIYREICKSVSGVLVIKNINIDEEFQGEGHGTEVLNNAINVSSARSAILISDSCESQRDGFSLDEFYRYQGFEVVTGTCSGNLMVYSKELAIQLNEVIKPKIKNKISTP
jgi:ribosomal protein S18 acetylase RimI-like enzyme